MVTWCPSRQSLCRTCRWAGTGSLPLKSPQTPPPRPAVASAEEWDGKNPDLVVNLNYCVETEILFILNSIPYII